MKRRTEFNYWMLGLMAILCLLGTIVSGLAAGVISAYRDSFGAAVTIRSIQPFHTSLALAWLFLGAQAFTGIYLAREQRGGLILSRAILALQLIFITGVTATSLVGIFSGREYLTWPPVLSLPLALAMVCSLLDIVTNFGKIKAHSPEAAWFLLLGFILLPAGLLENQLYLLNTIALNPGRDLVIQWHSLDMVIAAWSLMLYAVGMLILPPPGKPLRSGWLFVLAAIGILFDFGHHNYPSPQAHMIKVVSFSATMLATISFLRHVRAARKQKGLEGYAAFLRHIEFWILYAVGSGIFMAVPWVNYYVHGTYFVVGHTMGSIIGVNTLLIMAGLYHLGGGLPTWQKKLLIAFDVALVIFVLVFSALGIAKGILRPTHDFLEWSLWLKPYMIAIPIAAIPLTIILLWFSIDLLRSSWSMLRENASPDIM